MLQLLQHQKTGEIIIEELPVPQCFPGGVLVRNYYSLISAGTEKTSVTTAQSSLIGRVKKQPDQVKLVIDTFKKEGIINTYKRVQAKLDSFKTLGYSTAGEVIESDCDEFAKGDFVACAGAGYATHSEIISVPKNLITKIPENVSFEEAAYTTVGAIAMQGVRQADLRLGETVAVVGLGLLGQITVQLLKASGCRVIGMDINTNLFPQAKKFGCDVCYPSKLDDVKSIEAFTNGIGCDAVIITASTKSNEPVELALQICRKKGKIVVVGAVGMNLPRSPFYEKEIDFKISCSYGPGRYDPYYEEHGIDYPSSYVRWTENRNMQSFLELIKQKKVDVNTMTTHSFNIEHAAKAYKLITGEEQEPFLGVLLRYPERNDAAKKIIVLQTKKSENTSNIKIGFIGIGSFAQNYLIPPLKNLETELLGVANSTPATSLSIAKRLNIKYTSTDGKELIKTPDINMIFCATRHDSHANYVIESLLAKKPVFVEKPLAVNREELDRIVEEYNKNEGSVMVGFNRRFSKPFECIAEFFKQRTDAMAIHYRVNAGFIPKTNWVQFPEQGGRIIGEACHFIDCMVYLTNSLPCKVYAESISSNNASVTNSDNVVITIKFRDGSIGTLEYLANGDPSFPKEYCQIFCENSIATMNNFLSVEMLKNKKSTLKTFDGKKGHNEEIIATMKSIKNGTAMPISFEQIRAVTLATFAAIESLQSGTPVEI